MSPGTEQREFKVLVTLTGPVSESDDGVTPPEFRTTFAADEVPSDDELRVAIEQTRVAANFVARVAGRPGWLVEAIDVLVTDDPDDPRLA